VARIGGGSVPALDAWTRAVDVLAARGGLQMSTGSAASIRDGALAMLIGLVAQARRRNAQVVWVDDPSALHPALERAGVPPALIGAR